MKKDYNEPQFELYSVTTENFLSTSNDRFEDSTVPSIPETPPNGIY